MVSECEGGTPRRFVVKKPLKVGDVVQAGQYIRYEESVNLTDDQVQTACSDIAPNLCRTIEAVHLTYYHITNTLVITEGQAVQNFTVTAEIALNLYLLEPIWEAYKIPIILAIVALGGFAGFMALRKRK
jgi:hypothetical protein